jgi:hypothetical protein
MRLRLSVLQVLGSTLAAVTAAAAGAPLRRKRRRHRSLGARAPCPALQPRCSAQRSTCRSTGPIHPAGRSNWSWGAFPCSTRANGSARCCTTPAAPACRAPGPGGERLSSRQSAIAVRRRLVRPLEASARARRPSPVPAARFRTRHPIAACTTVPTSSERPRQAGHSAAYLRNVSSCVDTAVERYLFDLRLPLPGTVCRPDHPVP